MKIRSISLTNVRKFVGRTAILSGIGDGISVVSEANEFGKSTFFDSLHALFFEKFGSVAKPIKSLQPYAGGAVKVTAEIEHGGTNYLIEKRWLSQKGATIRNLTGGAIVAQDGEAEDWIAGVIGENREGPAGLLWVRQGVTLLEASGGTAAEKAEKERLTQTRRDLLSSVAGEIEIMTGGRRMDRVLRRCSEDLAKFTTSSGKPSGAWKAIQDEVNDLAQKHLELKKLCDDLAQALASRRDAEEEIARLESPAERARRDKDLKEAQGQEKNAEAHAGKTEHAENVLKTIGLEYDAAVKELHTLEAARQRLIDASAEEVRLGKAVYDANVNVSNLRNSENEALDRLETATQALKNLRSELERSHKHQASIQAAKRVEELRLPLGKAKQFRSDIETHSARLAANKATPQWLKTVEQANTDLVRLTTTQLAQAAQIIVTYKTGVRITLDGNSIPENKTVPLPRRAVIDLPGIGELQFEAGGGEEHRNLDKEVVKASDKLAQILSACGAKAVMDAHDLARLRQEEVDLEKLAEKSLALIAPRGIDDLQKLLAEAEGLIVSGGDDVGTIKSPDELTPAISESEENVDKQRNDFSKLQHLRGDAKEKQVRLTTEYEAALRELKLAEQAAGLPQDREDRRLKAAAKVTQIQVKQKDAQNAYESLMADATDLVTVKANLSRAEEAVKAVASRLKTLGEKQSALSATIELQAANGIEERRDEVSGRLETARLRSQLLAAEVAALIRLRDIIEETRNAAKDTYFEPIKKELIPLLRILHSDAALSFDTTSMLPTRLQRGDAQEEMESLSGGTQEQIAILTRLAFANLLAKQGKSMPIILDDALVYSDDSRIIKMFTALHRAAMNQQIIVFSCRQLAFVGLGGTKPILEISNVV